MWTMTNRKFKQSSKLITLNYNERLANVCDQHLLLTQAVFLLGVMVCKLLCRQSVSKNLLQRINLGPMLQIFLHLRTNLQSSLIYFVKILGHYTLKYSQSQCFHRGTISNLGTLFYTSPKL